MKNIEVTYDALICENGTYEQGEAAHGMMSTRKGARRSPAAKAAGLGT